MQTQMAESQWTRELFGPFFRHDAKMPAWWDVLLDVHALSSSGKRMDFSTFTAQRGESRNVMELHKTIHNYDGSFSIYPRITE